MSGTVGAAIEGAALGIPSMAVSLQLGDVLTAYLSHSTEVDSALPAFTQIGGRDAAGGALPEGRGPSEREHPAQRHPRNSLAHHLPGGLSAISNPMWNARRIRFENESAGRYHHRPGEVSPDSDIDEFDFDKVVSVTRLPLDMTVGGCRPEGTGEISKS